MQLQKTTKQDGYASLRYFCATAMLAGLIFLLFPIKDYFSSSSEQQPGFANLVPTEQVVRSQPSSEDGNEHLNAYEKMERADSLFLAATQDIVTPQEMKSSKMVPLPKERISQKEARNMQGRLQEIQKRPLLAIRRRLQRIREDFKKK